MKRAYVPKEDGSQRPIGMPTFEDKIVQRAVAMLLGAIYEQDFKDCSYGFREGRSPHQALHELRERCMTERIGWIVDADVSACFDSLDHGLLCAVVTPRVTDGAILRLIRKWLRAGVLEGETLSDPECGSPQGGVRTPPTMLQTFFFRARIAGVWIDPEHDLYLVIGHFHALDQCADHLSFSAPIRLCQPVLDLCRKVLQAPNNQAQVSVQGVLLGQLLALRFHSGRSVGGAG